MVDQYWLRGWSAPSRPVLPRAHLISRSFTHFHPNFNCSRVDPNGYLRTSSYSNAELKRWGGKSNFCHSVENSRCNPKFQSFGELAVGFYEICWNGRFRWERFTQHDALDGSTRWSQKLCEINFMTGHALTLNITNMRQSENNIEEKREC